MNKFISLLLPILLLTSCSSSSYSENNIIVEDNYFSFAFGKTIRVDGLVNYSFPYTNGTILDSIIYTYKNDIRCNNGDGEIRITSLDIPFSKSGIDEISFTFYKNNIIQNTWTFKNLFLVYVHTTLYSNAYQYFDPSFINNESYILKSSFYLDRAFIFQE